MVQSIRRTIVWGLFALLLSHCKSDSPSAPDNNNGFNSKLAFISTVNGVPQVFSMNPDGSGIMQITADAGRKAHPDWSPDGSRIVYSAEFNLGTPNGYSELYLIDSDGTGKQLIPDTRNAHNPAWSADGAKLVFEQPVAGNYDIYVVDVDGTNRTRLTTHPAFDGNPDWSLDGTMLSFESKRGSTQPFEAGLYVVNADGSEPRLIFFTRELFCSSWSLEGSKIIFGALQPVPGTSNEFVDLFTIKPDGTGLTRVTTDQGSETYPSFSPDGQQIAFMKDFRIYVMDADGSNVSLLEARGQTDEDPAWSPLLKPAPSEN